MERSSSTNQLSNQGDNIMSHFDSVRTCVTNLDTLAQACSAAGIKYQRQVGEQPVLARGYNDLLLPCPFIIEGSRYDIGFTLDGDEYVASADYADAHGDGTQRTSLEELLKRAITQYNVTAVQQTVKQGALVGANVTVTVH